LLRQWFNEDYARAALVEGRGRADIFGRPKKERCSNGLKSADGKRRLRWRRHRAGVKGL
jgi:hypothetical protein